MHAALVVAVNGGAAAVSRTPFEIIVLIDVLCFDLHLSLSRSVFAFICSIYLQFSCALHSGNHFVNLE